jgi:hypothetical protein
MDTIVMGSYATEQEALDAKAERREPQVELSVVEDNVDVNHPWRIYWTRAAA